MKRITWHLEGITRKCIVKTGAGIQQVFASLAQQDRADITNFCVDVSVEPV